MNDAHETLIARYLDGAAKADDMRRLDELVRTDEAFRRELLLASAMDAGLQESLAGDEEEISPQRVFSWRAPIAWACRRASM